MKHFLIGCAIVLAFGLGYTYRHIQAESSENYRVVTLENDLWQANQRIDGLVDALMDKAAMETFIKKLPIINVTLEFKQRSLPVKKGKK